MIMNAYSGLPNDDALPHLIKHTNVSSERKVVNVKPPYPEKVRVSLGSAILLDLIIGKIDVAPTTLYLLTYHPGKCRANCSFCSQARSSTSRSDRLSRVAWPVFSTNRFLTQLNAVGKIKGVQRICLQAINYPAVYEDTLNLIREFRKSNIPISISCQPFTENQIYQLVDAGIDRIGIPLDLPTEALFNKIKGNLTGSHYTWKTHLAALSAAVKHLGKGNVSTHFIAGLGETDYDLLHTMQQMLDMGVYPSLFAFTPIPGTPLNTRSQPPISRYRRLQIAHYLLVTSQTRIEHFTFNPKGCLLSFGIDTTCLTTVIQSGIPFHTSGCPGCNRPYYNERPGGILYNFPRKPNMQEIIKIEKQVQGECP
ncbi:MAG: radical SAM protein [Candidatus Bathyarchaeota archaeon]|nr:radical SAM protein [Candidatus Bathyarchaeota archaeon]